MIVRPTESSDAAGLAEVYADAVLHGLGTFEEEPPSPAEMEARRRRVAGFGLPHLVVQDEGGRVLGFAYAGPFRPRPAYRYTAEDTVYVHPDAKGRGVGRALLSEVVKRCTALGLRQLVALVGDSGNASSIRLHEALGFERAGLLPAVGHKHGRWVDVVWMRLALGDGAASAPDAPGLDLQEP